MAASLVLVCLVAGGTLAQSEVPFTDMSEATGLDFVHFNGMTGELSLPEITGHGGAFVDYDNDGDLDVYLVQGAILGVGKTLADALSPYRGPSDPHDPHDRLYRNNLSAPEDGSPIVRFEDVTEIGGIWAPDYGMGVASGDIDNDGWPDLFITNYGANQLFLNNGDGTFSEVSEAAGVADSRWGTSASLFDFDRDGFLDLYVANYVDFDFEDHPRCYALSSRRDYCGPSAFDPQSDILYRNQGDGTFQDVTAQALVGATPAPGLGVVVADFDEDGWVDVYVANDGRLNQLWINQKDGTFFDDALLAGVAVNREGQAEASMGVDAGDFDSDGDEDLFMTHLMGETNTLYVNDGNGMFEDRTSEMGLAPESLTFTSFGTGWFDYDNDGWLDLLILNGAVRILEALALEGDPYPLRQRNQLFHGVDGKTFESVTEDAGEPFELAEVSRGAAFGDVDNDGDIDILLNNNNGPARLLINNVGNRSAWLGLRLIGREEVRDAFGARVEVIREGDSAPLWRRARSDGSYCSASDHRMLIGLGDLTSVEAVRVYWPDGQVQELERPPLGRYITLRRQAESQ
jgi:hypothetical protein